MELCGPEAGSMLLQALQWQEENLLSSLQIYNETKYGALNNLDYRQDIGTFKEKAHSAAVNTLSLDPLYGRYLLSGSSDSSIKLWDLQAPAAERTNGDSALKYAPVHVLPRKSVHAFGVTKVKWWPDNGMWLSASYDFRVNLYDAGTMEAAHSFRLGARVLDLDFPALGSSPTVVACLDGGVGGLKLLDLRTLSDSQTLGGGGLAAGGVGYMSSCVFSPSNEFLCIGGGIEGSCYGWDIRSSAKYLFELDSGLTASAYERKQPAAARRSPILQRKAHHGNINSLLFTPGGTELLTLGNDEKLRIWDMCSYPKPTNKSINFGPLIRNKTRQRVDMCLSPSLETDISFLWLPSDSGEILVYRVEDGSLLARLHRGSHRANTRSYSVVSAGHNQIRYYSGCKDGNIAVWGHDSTHGHPQLPVPFDNGVDIVPAVQPDHEPL